jgi:hypothetical protein
MDTELRRAEMSRDYGDDLRSYLDDLTVLYESMLAKWARGSSDEELLNTTLSKMISIMAHLLPKLDGGGQKTKELRKKFEPYEAWIDSIQIPKNDDAEADKIPQLYLLILQAYDKLGLTSIR